MRPWHGWTLLGIAVLALIAGLFWAVMVTAQRFAVEAGKMAVAHNTVVGPLPQGRVFTREQTYAFLEAAKRAEAIADPLQRCLAYPDPPGSHWDHDAVVAYCRYRYQPIVTFAQAQQLIQSGHAAELDQQLANALKAQRTQPDAHGRLDRIFYADFYNGSFDIRPTLDAWKRQSPNSAFAYAASGYAYVQMAYDARGTKEMTETPQGNVDSMDRLAVEADADLRRAVALNPDLTPVYKAMITLGGLTFGREYALSAARRGLAAEPDDWDIYAQLMWLEEPKWYGSLAEMTDLAARAQTYAYRNPLLKLLDVERDFYRIDNCSCAASVQLPAYIGVLDRLAGSGFLLDAGDSAKDAGNPQAMTVYLSETLRFNADLDDARIDRIYDLVEFDNAHWAVDEADKLIAKSPDNEYALKARGWAYEVLGDFANAERDYRAASRLDPEDMWVLVRLGSVYLQWNHQWDKAWDVANTLVEKDPQHVDGWLLRGYVQEHEPRPGLKDTADYLAAHFGTDLRVNVAVAHMRTTLMRQAKPQHVASMQAGARN